MGISDQIYTVFLSKIIGICLTVLMLGILFNRKHFKEMASSIINTPSIQFVAALLPLILGSIIVITHTGYDDVACVLIGIIGWLAFISGIVRALFPTFWINKMSKHYSGAGVVVVSIILLIIGIALLYAGFVKMF